MYATLGEIIFETLTSPESFESSRKFTYAEHKVVEARPVLQWISDDLEVITIELRFHVAFVNPVTALALLDGAAEDHQARALVFGNGTHRGYFVVSEIIETHKHAADDGSLIWAEAKVELKEFTLGAAIDPAAPPQPATPPAGIIVAPAGTAAGSIGAGGAAPFNPNAPIGPANLLPTSAIATLGALPAGSYQPPGYNAPGVSPIVTAASGASGPNLAASDVPPSEIVS